MSYLEKVKEARKDAVNTMSKLVKSQQSEVELEIARNKESDVALGKRWPTDIRSLKERQQSKRYEEQKRLFDELNSLANEIQTDIDGQCVNPMSEQARAKVHDLQTTKRQLTNGEYCVLANSYGKEPEFLESISPFARKVDAEIINSYPNKANMAAEMEEIKKELKGAESDLYSMVLSQKVDRVGNDSFFF